MQVYIKALSLPLFFVTAWAMSNRNLSAKLAYRLPLALRCKLPSIRMFWLIDLVFSAIPFVAIWQLANLPALLLDKFPVPVDPQVSYLVYPLSAALLGFMWPYVSEFSVALGANRFSVSIGRLRDYFLGGPTIRSINARLTAEVESYINRVLAIAGSPNESSAASVEALIVRMWMDSRGTRASIPELRDALVECVKKDFESVYRSISGVKMIPLIDRGKPLMKIPNISCREEQKLYDAGVRSIWQLMRAADTEIGGIPRSRVTVLRSNARRAAWQRLNAALVLAMILVVVAGLGVASGKLNQERHVTAGAAEPSPHNAASPEDAKVRGLYPAKAF